MTARRFERVETQGGAKESMKEAAEDSVKDTAPSDSKEAVKEPVKDAGKAIAKDAAQDPRRKEALSAALKAIEKIYGAEAIRRLGDRTRSDVEAVSTGSLSLDLALGVGGLPRGRVTEIFGPEGSGKTTLALHVVANVQRAGGTAAFVDAEHALDPAYAARLGVKVGDLLVSQPDTGEQGLEITDMLVRSGGIDVVVIDSVAALVPLAEIEGQMGDSHVGLQARLMSQALRKLTGAIHKSNTMVIFINQLREKIGVMFGSPETTPGGRALKFYSSVRLDVRRIASLKRGEDDVYGNRVRVKVAKNKVASPFRKAEFDMLFGKGISYAGDVLDLSELGHLIIRRGSWYVYGETQMWQGREASIRFLEENPNILRGLAKQLREAAIEPGQEIAKPARAAGASS